MHTRKLDVTSRQVGFSIVKDKKVNAFDDSSWPLKCLLKSSFPRIKLPDVFSFPPLPTQVCMQVDIYKFLLICTFAWSLLSCLLISVFSNQHSNEAA